ncbi:MAG: hypothetical protein IPQ13_14335 [Holophagaceae bacterium]|nr:hypothetical protein [Holophagaceae bacterium]
MNFWKLAIFSALVSTCGLFSHASESIVGTWTYRQGSFTDVHVYHANGTVTAPSSAAAHAKWWIEGDEIVSFWHNKWYNRLKLPIANSAISGVSISPTGVRAAVTLTRIGSEPKTAPPAAESIVGTWTYRQGSFTDVHVYHADGTVTAPSSAAAHAKWWIEGNEIVSFWHNKWYNRLKLPIVNSAISGVSISPTGARAAVTLTRVGGVPTKGPTDASPTAGSIVGTWTYHHTSGMFTDIHVYHGDGTVTAPNNAEAHATWRVEGNEIVSFWHNKWYNRLKLPITGSTIYGVSISPNGGSAEITLTRVGTDGGKDVQNPDGPFSNPINISGKWNASFINRRLNFRQSGSHVTAEYGIQGDFTAPNVLTGTWRDAASGIVNKFQFVFSKDANYITGGFWDRNTGNFAYSRSNIINGAHRDGVTPPR